MNQKIQILATQCGQDLGQRVVENLTGYVNRRMDKLNEKESSGAISADEVAEKQYIRSLFAQNKSIRAKHFDDIPQSERELRSFLLSPAKYTRFADGEFITRLNESVRGQRVFLIHAPYEPLSFSEEFLEEFRTESRKRKSSDLDALLRKTLRQHRSISDNTLECFQLASTLKECSASAVHLMSPYLAFSRQDHRNSREGIMAAQLAKQSRVADIDSVFFTELHSKQTVGYYSAQTPAMPADNYDPFPLLVNQFCADNDVDCHNSSVPAEYSMNLSSASPDAGGAARANYVAKLLNAGLVLAHKNRDYSVANCVTDMIIIGEPKEHAVIVDDMIDTAGTMLKAMTKLTEQGVKKIDIMAPHALLSGPGLGRLNEAYENGPLNHVYITDSIPRPAEFFEEHKWAREVSLAPIMAETIYKMAMDRSVSGVYRG